MFRKIYLDAPNVGRSEKKYLNTAIDSGYVSTIGPYVPEFEVVFAKYLKIKRAVSTQSGTAALHIALHELGVGKGDEVIVPALTFVATINPIIYVGATPIFVDVDSNTWNISPLAIKKNITRRTKAILPVHLYGNPCEMNEIMAIARKHNLFVIEDATESLGAQYENSYTGTFGDFGCFSFNGNKVITTGGGGMVVGKDLRQLEHAKFLVNQARDESKEYYYPEIGFNYRMTNIEAALGLAQMERLNNFLAKKKRFNAIYRQELGVLEEIRFQEEYCSAKSSSWLTCIVCTNEIDVPLLQKKLREKKIPTRRIFMPATSMSPYRRHIKSSMKNTYAIYQNGLCLPSSTLNTDIDIKYVCKALRRILT